MATLAGFLSMNMTKVKFFDPGYKPDIKLTYSVIVAKYGDYWLFVRHHKRETWEIPGGHIEKNESADEAAGRELMEETGAVDFKLECVATYSVQKNGETGFGRLYLADIIKVGPVPDTSEIAEVKMMASLPANLTHPDIQPQLFERILEHIKNKS
jgi:8-oxo-dGTP diphosphatase